MTRLNRNKVVEILRLTSCENLVCDGKEFIFDTFIYSEPVKRSKNRSDVTRFWGSGDSTSKFQEKFQTAKVTSKVTLAISRSRKFKIGHVTLTVPL